jgi:hypothetical protein
LVAAGHLIFQVSRLPYSVAETITSADVEVQKYASALEAPLNICETFSMVALLAAACCGPWWQHSGPKLRRLAAVLLTGLLSWGTENMMFAMATLSGVKANDATLSRPYLFFITPIVATTWGVLTSILGRMIGLGAPTGGREDRVGGRRGTSCKTVLKSPPSRVLRDK